MANATSERPRGFHVMTKPAGPLCNLDCTYCFYLEKEKIYPGQRSWAMPDEALESYVKQYIEAQDAPVVTFAWQGGEPTTLGVDFFRRAVALEQKYANGKEIHNAFQTNGVLLDDEWCAFFAENNFLIGLSIDGPREEHDFYRVDKGGHPTFDKVFRGLKLLKKHGAEFNTLTCVQRRNSYRPLEVYRFLREHGSGHIQFIPIVERAAKNASPDDLVLVLPNSEQVASVTPWSVEPRQYGEFLCAVFDEWVRKDVGEVFVQIFEESLSAWYGAGANLCVFRPTCGEAMALEHNGDLYSCDHYVYPEYLLGNILDTPLQDLAFSERQRKFGRDKRDSLPRYCRECGVRFMCNGECPKHRFIKTPDGEDGLNYLCAGYKRFFTHIDPYMRYMAEQLKLGRSPATVRRYARELDLQREGKTTPEPNDLCLCGSGKKYKKCCGSAT